MSLFLLKPLLPSINCDRSLLHKKLLTMVRNARILDLLLCCGVWRRRGLLPHLNPLMNSLVEDES